MYDTHGLTFLSVLRARVLSAWLPAAVFVLLIALWEGAAHLALVDPMVLPAPSDIAANFVDGFQSGIYAKNLQVTLFQAFSALRWPAYWASASARLLLSRSASAAHCSRS